MSSKIQYLYNPKLSVRENALICGVSEDTVRQFIKMKGIDRHFDNMRLRYKKVKSLQKKGLNAQQISVKVGCCLNTAKKYMAMDSFDTLPKKQKDSAVIKTSNKSIIKSVSYNQSEILHNIIKLHIKQGIFDADFTYSTGRFYADGIVPEPRQKYDKYPQVEGVLELEEAYKIPDSTLKAAIYDLPFIITGKYLNGRVHKRFNSFENVQHAYETNTKMLELAYKKLSNRGVLVMKTMDALYTGKQIWMTHFVISEAERLGLKLRDMFVLIAENRMLSQPVEQKYARKYHSYFLVFKK